jgi:hypothetical protein
MKISRICQILIFPGNLDRELAKFYELVRQAGRDGNDRPGNQGNFFDVTYSWEGMTLKDRIIPAGEVRTEGREQDDKFLFQWTNKQGRKFEIILKKFQDNEVKARLEKSGPMGSKERPYNETTLHRR